MTNLEALNALYEKATGGEWFYDGMCYLFTKTKNNNQMLADDHLEHSDDTIRMRGTGANLPLETNAELIAALHNAFPALKRELLAGRKLAEAVKQYADIGCTCLGLQSPCAHKRTATALAEYESSL